MPEKKDVEVKADETKDETPVEEPVAEETPSEEPVAEEAPAEEPVAGEPPAEEPVAEEPPAEEEPAPPVEEAPAEGEPAPEADPPDETPAAEADTAPAAESEEAPGAEAAVSPRKPKRKPRPRSERRQRSKPKREQVDGRKPITRLPKPEGERGRRVERRGVVVSSAMDKTIVVRVDTVKAHPRYKKVVRRSARFHAHDEQNAANVGDVVLIVETRPLSKTKNWRLAQVLEVAK